MTKKTNPLVFLAAVLLLAGCAGPEKRIAGAQAAIQEASRAKDIPGVEGLARNIPDSYLTGTRLAAYPEPVLDGLFKTLRTIAFWTPDSEANALRLERAFAEKVRRGTFGTEQVEQAYEALLAARLFDKAREMRARFPAIITAALPDIVVPEPAPKGNWLAYELSADGKTARLRSLRLHRGAYMIMAMMPGCGVSVRAVKEIMEDPGLGPTFGAGAVLVTGRFDAAGVIEAKNATGLDQVYIAHKWGDFPGVNFTTSPWIFFVKDGKVVSDMRGWADEGEYSLRRLRKGMESIGLKPGPSN